MLRQPEQGCGQPLGGLGQPLAKSWSALSASSASGSGPNQG